MGFVMRLARIKDGLTSCARLSVTAIGVWGAGCTEDVPPTMSPQIANVEAVSGPVVGGCCGGGAADPAMNGLRLSLAATDAVPKGDLTGRPTAYFVPFESSAIALYDGSAWVARTMTATAEVATTGVPSTSYDVYAYWDEDDADVRLELVATPVTPTLELQDGVQVKPGDAKRRYVGVVATSASGSFEDSAKNRLVWNRNNQVPRAINGNHLDSAWYYTGNQSTWREARGNPASRVTVASGVLNGNVDVAGTYASVQAAVMCVWNSGATGAFVAAGIGIDSTTDNSAQTVEPSATTAGYYAHAFSSYEGYLTPGLHTLHWLEIGQTGTTFYCIGSATSPPFGRLGINGMLVM